MTRYTWEYERGIYYLIDHEPSYRYVIGDIERYDDGSTIFRMYPEGEPDTVREWRDLPESHMPWVIVEILEVLDE